MELLGKRTGGGDVAALSPSGASDTAFASLSSDGTVSVWDTRLSKRNYLNIPTARSRGDTCEGTEVLFAADRNLVVALCDRHVRFVDVRSSLAVLGEYTHTSEVVRFVAGAHPHGRCTTLMIDENGTVVPLDLQTMQPTAVVEEWVFGGQAEAPPADHALGRSTPGFGQLSNYCCGLGLVDTAARAAADEEADGSAGPSRALVAVGMDGNSEFHPSPAVALPFTVAFDSLAAGTAPQMVNPPLPVCAAFHKDRVAVGKADGTYEVLAVADGAMGLEELMAAPGHASNGLCYLQWAAQGRQLLTASLCGQVTVWAVAAFMEADEDCYDDLPAIVAALDHRECVGSRTAVLNGGSQLARDKYLLCDSEGNVTLTVLDGA